MLDDHMAVFKLDGQACNLCDTTAVWAQQYALAPMRHLLSQ